MTKKKMDHKSCRGSGSMLFKPWNGGAGLGGGRAYRRNTGAEDRDTGVCRHYVL